MTPNGDRVFLFNQRGQLILAKLSSEKYEEMGRCLLLEPTAGFRPQEPVTWAHPAYANKSIYARNDKELVCASLSASDVSTEALEPGLQPSLKFAKAFGEDDPVRSLAISPDGKQVAGGTWRGAVKLVDWQSAEVLPPPVKHKRTVTSLDFSPDGKLLVSGSADWQIHLWDSVTKERKGSLEGHGGTVYSLDFSPDGKTLATGSGDETVKLWDIPTGNEVMTLRGHESGITSLVFTNDGSSLISTGRNDGVRLWSIKSE